ncbi:MAG: leucyl/phenylalanyl-tRNA--protein transferase [Gammaproteobacteria bacterium]|nr:leucyl/phenylalanyl-tRNA--protein transferase [Gammaproteobacteria bacterium]MDH4254566.1 leucyl/phenylalanyl-tRNA--protein transferase [Gammaproteobacteria bacterium]MDH5310898.1 leucyl/phenylalanyl-tRNA--protein transferase [Gammaproteobacteria bacterium]
MRTQRIAWLGADEPPDAFPDIDAALADPPGLLAVGGDLSTSRLLYAYRHGIFPWYDEGQAILWWSPDPRCVLEPGEFHVSRRLARSLRVSGFQISFNHCFSRVIGECAAPRRHQRGTWITAGMRAAYEALHGLGWAHSIEVWHEEQLVGGLYGIGMGNVFFGESMFSRTAGASKAAMLALCRELIARGGGLLDCQVVSPHLLTLGAKPIPRTEFRALLDRNCGTGKPVTGWPEGRRRCAAGLDPAQ